MNRRPPASPSAGAGDLALSEPLPGEGERRRVLARPEAAFADDQSSLLDEAEAVLRGLPTDPEVLLLAAQTALVVRRSYDKVKALFGDDLDAALPGPAGE